MIRKMTFEDIPRVHQIEEESFSVAWSKEAFETEFSNQLAYYIVAEADSQVVGYAGLWEVLGEGQVTNIAVDKKYRGKGIGKALVQALIDYAKKAEMFILYLEVRESNEAAKGLYTSYGFCEIAKRKAYYHKPTEDAVMMQMELMY